MCHFSIIFFFWLKEAYHHTLGHLMEHMAFGPALPCAAIPSISADALCLDGAAGSGASLSLNPVPLLLPLADAVPVHESSATAAPSRSTAMGSQVSHSASFQPWSKRVRVLPTSCEHA